MIWELATDATGGLALTFIVTIAVAIFALACLYLASAVVVLERFARRAKGFAAPAAFVLAVGAVATGLFVRLRSPELATADFWSFARAWAGALPPVIAVTASFAALCSLVMRLTGAETRGIVALQVLGLGGALWLGSTGNVAFSAAPAAAIAAIPLGLALVRHGARAAGSVPVASELERQLRWVALALACGALLALSHGEPAPALAAVGEAVFLGFFGVVVLGLLPLAAAGLVRASRSVEWFIAVRYLLAKRRQVFISAITAICVGGIAAGVWLIIIVLSVMNGFEQTWREEILGNRAHFTVNSAEGGIPDPAKVLGAVRGVPGVVAATPYLDAEGMVRGPGGQILSVVVRGIEPETIGQVTDLPQDVILGALDDLTPAPGAEGDAALPGIVVGNQLAVSVGATVGDELLLISPFGGAKTPLGPAPRLVRFRVAGVYQTSFFQYDEVYAYVGLAAAQAFRHAGPVIDGIEVRTVDFYRSLAVGAAVAERLGEPYFTRDWKEFFPAFFQALRTERMMMFVLLMMIMVVAAFLIVATLVMMIMEKSSDIAILKAMGAEDETVERIFAIEGTLIGVVGTVLGMVAGIAVTGQLEWIQARIEDFTGADQLPVSIYQFSTLPSEVDPAQVAVVSAIAMVLSLGATWLPSRQGARLDPAEGLRYE